jgi:hypothetical protein
MLQLLHYPALLPDRLFLQFAKVDVASSSLVTCSSFYSDVTPHPSMFAYGSLLDLLPQTKW